MRLVRRSLSLVIKLSSHPPYKTTWFCAEYYYSLRGCVLVFDYPAPPSSIIFLPHLLSSSQFSFFSLYGNHDRAIAQVHKTSSCDRPSFFEKPENQSPSKNKKNQAPARSQPPQSNLSSQTTVTINDNTISNGVSSTSTSSSSTSSQTSSASLVPLTPR